MSALGNIIVKEIKELLTPATILPIVVMAIIFGSMGNTVGGIEEELGEPPIIGIINADDGNLSTLAVSVLEKNAKVIFNISDISEKTARLEELQNNDGVALIVIHEDFSDNILNGKPGEFEIFWMMKGAGILDSLPSSVLEELITIVNTNITLELISGNESINATTTLTPTYRNETTYFKGKELKGLSPSQIANILGSQSTLIPVIIMIIIIMAGQMVISSMALEKENKTLETLLTLPVKRTSIVAGKIIAAAIIGLLLAVIYMFGLGYYMASFQFQGQASVATFELTLSGVDLLLIGLSIFVTLIAALAFCMLLGTMAKNFKSAQTLTFPVAMLALIPMFVTMFKDFDTLPVALKGILFGIPFSHPMMAPRALIFDDYMLVIGGIIYVSIFALIMIAIAVWVFKTDKLLTGSTRFKWKTIFKKR
jgi:ABC-2 type transport system permease protein